MARYIQDPINNPKPSLRVTSIKEYKDVAETLYKIVAGATPSGSKDKPKSPMFEALSPNKKVEELEDDEDDKPLSITAVAEHAELSPVKGE
jgi:hypothetical protein